MLVNISLVMIVVVAPVTVFYTGYWFANGGARKRGSHE